MLDPTSVIKDKHGHRIKSGVTQQECHAGLDPASVIKDKHRHRIKSGVTSDVVGNASCRA